MHSKVYSNTFQLSAGAWMNAVICHFKPNLFAYKFKTVHKKVFIECSNWKTSVGESSIKNALSFSFSLSLPLSLSISISPSSFLSSSFTLYLSNTFDFSLSLSLSLSINLSPWTDWIQNLREQLWDYESPKAPSYFFRLFKYFLLVCQDISLSGTSERRKLDQTTLIYFVRVAISVHVVYYSLVGLDSTKHENVLGCCGYAENLINPN